MGFDNECIKNIHSLKGEYFCPICRVLVYPDEALKTQCGHLYCKPCLSYVAQTTKICPYDGMFVSESESKPLHETDSVLADTIWQISVHCLYYKSGCTWEGTLFECLSHSFGCAFGNSTINCNRCGVLILHMQMPEHLKFCTNQVMHAQQYQLQPVQQAPPSQAPQLPQQPNQAPSHMQQIQPSRQRQRPVHNQLASYNVRSRPHITYSKAQTYVGNRLVGQDMEILLDYAPANHNQLAYAQLHAGIQRFPQQYMRMPLSSAHLQPMHSQVASHARPYAQQQPGPQAVPQQATQMSHYYQTYPPMEPLPWVHSNVFHSQTHPPMQNQPEQNPNPIVQGQSSQQHQVPAQVPSSAQPVLARLPSLNNPSGLVPPNNLSGNVSGLGSVTPVARGHVNIGLPQSPVTPVARGLVSIGLPQSPVTPVARGHVNIGLPQSPVTPVARGLVSIGLPQSPVTPVARGHVSIGLPQSPLNQVMPPYPPAPPLQFPPLQVPVQRPLLPLQPPQRLNSGMTGGVSLQAHAYSDGRDLRPSHLVEGRNRERGLGFRGSSHLNGESSNKFEVSSTLHGSSNQASGDGMNINSSPLEEPAPVFGPMPAFGPSSSRSLPPPQRGSSGQGREDILTSKSPVGNYAGILQAVFESFPGGGSDANKAHSFEEESRGFTFPSVPKAIHGGVRPSHFRSVENSGHPPRGGKPSFPNSSQPQQRYNLPTYAYRNGPGFKSGNSSQQRAPERGFYLGELDPSNHNTRKRQTMSIMCQVCNVTVEDLEMHSQTVQHRVAMGIFTRQQKNSKKPKWSSDHSPLDGGHYPRNGNPDDHDNNGNAAMV